MNEILFYVPDPVIVVLTFIYGVVMFFVWILGVIMDSFLRFIHVKPTAETRATCWKVLFVSNTVLEVSFLVHRFQYVATVAGWTIACIIPGGFVARDVCLRNHDGSTRSKNCIEAITVRRVPMRSSPADSF